MPDRRILANAAFGCVDVCCCNDGLGRECGVRTELPEQARTLDHLRAWRCLRFCGASDRAGPYQQIWAKRFHAGGCRGSILLAANSQPGRDGSTACITRSGSATGYGPPVGTAACASSTLPTSASCVPSVSTITIRRFPARLTPSWERRSRSTADVSRWQSMKKVLCATRRKWRGAAAACTATTAALNSALIRRSAVKTRP